MDSVHYSWHFLVEPKYWCGFSPQTVIFGSTNSSPKYNGGTINTYYYSSHYSSNIYYSPIYYTTIITTIIISINGSTIIFWGTIGGTKNNGLGGPTKPLFLMGTPIHLGLGGNPLPPHQTAPFRPLSIILYYKARIL